MGLEEKLPAGFVLTTLENVVGYMRKASIWPATFGLACCAIEMMAVGTPDYDIARFGMERFSATPRQADLMIVAGRVSQKMAPVVRQVYDQMPNPKWVISMGVCASSGGMFNNYAIVQGVDHIIPVDIYLPGCPPRPEMLLNAIIELHKQIQGSKLGVNRVAAARAAEEAAMAATPTSLMAPTHDHLAHLGGADREEPPGMSDENDHDAEPRTPRPGRPRPGDRHPGDLTVDDPDALRRRTPPTSPPGASCPTTSASPSWSVSGAACSAPPAARTPPATAGWSRRRCSPAPPRGPTARTSTRSPTGSAPPSPRPTAPGYHDAVEKVVVDRGELTLFVRREHLLAVARAMRDVPELRFEMCSGVSGVHYPGEEGRELHAVYHLLSITHGSRRVRLEVTAPDADPHIPSIVSVYPSNDWHERETWDMFGIIFDGHPALTRILMPDDWPGHPQRKDYPLGGIPVEYKGGTVPPPDQRRAYS